MTTRYTAIDITVNYTELKGMFLTWDVGSDLLTVSIVRTIKWEFLGHAAQEKTNSTNTSSLISEYHKM